MSYHHGDLRNVLLQVAEDLLNREGVAALSLRQVAKSAGVSHSAPYRHFANKAKLLAALAQAGFERLEAAITKAASDNPDDPARQLLEAGIAYITLAVSHRETAQLMFGGMVDVNGSVPELKDAVDKAFQALTDIVATGQRAGLYRDADTKVLAIAAWSIAHGLAMLITGGHLKTDGESWNSIAELTVVIDRLLYEGIANRKNLEQ